MRRREQAGPDARGAESSVDHRAGGTFPVGPGDVDGPKRILRIAQRREDGTDAVEPELGGLNLVAERVEKPHGVGVGEHRRALLIIPLLTSAPPSQSPRYSNDLAATRLVRRPG